jgi:pilus assembly protein CpaB
MGRRALLLIAAVLIAAVGTALVWFYVQGADGRAHDNAQTVKVWVATSDLSTGATWAQIAGSARVVDFPKQSLVAESVPADPVGAATRLARLSLQQPVPAGTPLMIGMFGGAAQVASGIIEDKHLAVTVTLADPARAAGLLRPDSHIAIFLTTTQGGTPKTHVLLSNIRVLAAGGQVKGSDTPGGVPQALVALELTEHQAGEIIISQAGGGTTTNSLWFALQGKGFTADGTTITPTDLSSPEAS